MSCATHHLGVVLIGHDDEKIRGSHAELTLKAPRRTGIDDSSITIHDPRLTIHGS
jgi:hypothetical protein